MKAFLLLFPLFTAVLSLQNNNKDVNHNKPQPITMIFDSIKINYDTLYFKDGADVTYKHNYFIINSENSSFIKKHKIGTIPRYMLFDKDGKLLDANAPRPSNDDINKFLTEL